MKDEKKMYDLRKTVIRISAILMFITVGLKMLGFQVLIHTILCSCVLLLIIVTLIFDGILKDRKEMVTHGLWFIAWVFNLIII